MRLRLSHANTRLSTGREGETAFVHLSRKVNVLLFLLKHNGSGKISATADANMIVFYINSWECN